MERGIRLIGNGQAPVVCPTSAQCPFVDLDESKLTGHSKNIGKIF
jgi:hypothetical protein